MKWTAEDDGFIKENWNRLSYVEMAEALGRTRNSVAIRTTGKLGLKRPQYLSTFDYPPHLKLSEIEKAWLACAVDSEGCIELNILKRNEKEKRGRTWYYSPRVTVANTSVKFIEHTGNLLQDISFRRELRPPSPRGKQVYQVITKALPGIRCLLKEIEPYFVIKNQQADLIIEFIDIQEGLLRKLGWREKIEYTSRQHQIYEEIKKLNKRGI